MKLFKRLTQSQPVERIDTDVPESMEPQGHVHPDYRHWTWFKPRDRAQ